MELLDNNDIFKITRYYILDMNVNNASLLKCGDMNKKEFVKQFVLHMLQELELPISIIYNKLNIELKNYNTFKSKYISDITINALIFDDLKSKLYNILLKMYDDADTNNELLQLVGLDYTNTVSIRLKIEDLTYA